MNTDDTVLSIYRVILIYMVSEREFLFSFPRFHSLQLYWLVSCFALPYRQRVIYWLMSEL